MWNIFNDIVLFSVPVLVILEIMIYEARLFRKQALRDVNNKHQVELLTVIDQLMRERKKNRRLFIVYFVAAVVIKTILWQT